MESMNKIGRILMVEDDPKDVELTLTALSTCLCSINSHRKLNSLIVVWDATELSFDCQTTVLRMFGTQGSVTYFPLFPESTPTDASVSAHDYCVKRSKSVSLSLHQPLRHS